MSEAKRTDWDQLELAKKDILEAIDNGAFFVVIGQGDGYRLYHADNTCKACIGECLEDLGLQMQQHPHLVDTVQQAAPADTVDTEKPIDPNTTGMTKN